MLNILFIDTITSMRHLVLKMRRIFNLRFYDNFDKNIKKNIFKTVILSYSARVTHLIHLQDQMVYLFFLQKEALRSENF